MKKFLSTFAMALVALTATAQQSQQYFRVKFDVPMTGYNLPAGQSSNNSIAATMKDNYVYCNPEHNYLDFQATDNPMSFRTTNPSNVSETSSFYIQNNRVTQSGMGQEKYPYLCDHITSITAYSIPVETVVLLDSTEAHTIDSSIFPGEMPTGAVKTYTGAEFTFNRLPRNVAELKTLMEDGNGNRVEACNNPLFIAAVGYLIWPRLLDCSQDCRDMWDYLYGKQYSQLNTTGISNQTFQNACIAQLDGKDAAGAWVHYNLFKYFGGATPGNGYKPNGKGHGVNDGPFKVRVAWDVKEPLSYDANARCYVASILLFPNPDAKTKDEIGFENPVGYPVKLRSTNKNGWFLRDGEKLYYTKGKAQYDEDF